eukprot:89038-Heterocapsa_arctica.AAC.1
MHACVYVRHAPLLSDPATSSQSPAIPSLALHCGGNGPPVLRVRSVGPVSSNLAYRIGAEPI